MQLEALYNDGLKGWRKDVNDASVTVYSATVENGKVIVYKYGLKREKLDITRKTVTDSSTPKLKSKRSTLNQVLL